MKCMYTCVIFILLCNRLFYIEYSWKSKNRIFYDYFGFLPEFGQHSMTSSLVPTPAALVCNWAIDCCAMIVVHRIADGSLDEAE